MPHHVAVVLLSSGLDSAVVLSRAIEEFDNVWALTVDYGQKARRELEKASLLASHFNVEHLTIELPWLKEWSQASALVGPSEIPDIEKRWHPEQTAQAVWVPARNLVFVSVAAAFVESRGGGAVAAGFNAEEGETFPDNSPSFVEALSRTLYFGTAGRVALWTPLLHMRKKDIASEAVKRKIPLQHLWFCYRNGIFPCFRCESCTRFIRGFQDAGLTEALREAFGEVRMD